MASSHKTINYYNNVYDVDDTIIVEGEIVSINRWDNSATVKLPRWGEVEGIKFFYH